MADTLLYRVYGSKNARCLHTVGSPDATSDGAATAAYFSVHVALVRASVRAAASNTTILLLREFASTRTEPRSSYSLSQA